MKKVILTTAILFISTQLFLSCSKTSSSPASSSAIGYWFGAFDNSIPEGQVFKSDGTTVQYDFYGTTITDTAKCPYKAYGTYTLVGDSIKFQIVYPTVGGESFTESAAIKTTGSSTTMNGTFSSSNGGGTGTFSFTKQ